MHETIGQKGRLLHAVSHPEVTCFATLAGTGPQVWKSAQRVPAGDSSHPFAAAKLPLGIFPI
jgi:hypothetical protein